MAEKKPDKFIRTKGIGAVPPPSWGRTILNTVTGYPLPNESPGIGDVLMAGLPFASIVGKAGKVFHGSPKVFDRFNPRIGTPNQVLYGMTHFAENSDYADLYAKGLFSEKYIPKKEMRSNIIPAQIHAKNTLDLTKELSPDDLQAVMANIPWQDRRRVIDEMRQYQREGRMSEFPHEVLLKEVDYPDTLDTIPFDAIRYRAHNTEPAWAVPPETKITTPGGLDLSPIRTGEKIKNPKYMLPEAKKGMGKVK